MIFSHANGIALRMAMSLCRSTTVVQTEKSQSIGWDDMKLCLDIHGSQTMNLTDFGDVQCVCVLF